jgi:hypothetical protein
MTLIGEVNVLFIFALNERLILLHLLPGRPAFGHVGVQLLQDAGRRGTQLRGCPPLRSSLMPLR